MAQISNDDADSFGDLLKSSAAASRAAGQTGFDLTEAAQAKFAAALAEWQAAVDAAKATGQ